MTHRYVFIVPSTTTDQNAAVDAFTLTIQADAISGELDLAKGAGGDYRYLTTSVGGTMPVTSAALLRSLVFSSPLFK